MVNIKNENVANYVMFKLDKIHNEFTQQELESLTELVFNPINIAGESTPANLDDLKYFSGLKTLEISNVYIEEKHLTYLTKMQNLKELFFKNCKIECVENIQNLKLDHLSFFNCNINEDFVYKMQGLKSLAIVNQKIDLKKLNNLQNLQYLQISYSKITENQIILPNLEELYIDNTNLLNLEFTLKLTKLKRLSISKNQIEKNTKVINQLIKNGVSVMNENMVRVEVANG